MSEYSLFDDGEPIIVAAVVPKVESNIKDTGDPKLAAKLKARKEERARILRERNRKKHNACQRRSNKRRRAKENKKPVVGIFKAPDGHDIEWATEKSVCFDIRAYLKVNMKVNTWTPANAKIEKPVKKILTNTTKVGIVIKPAERVLVPTGMIIDIPDGYSIRLHPRSGTALKQGLGLANCEGVIDTDYVNPLFIALINNSGTSVTIYDGERLAQGELIVAMTKDKFDFIQLDAAPKQKTNRSGGFGSTGKK